MFKYVLKFDGYKKICPFPKQKERVKEEKELLPALADVFNMVEPKTKIYSLTVYKRFLFFFWRRIYVYFYTPELKG